jgi:hypothetical protein
MTKLFLALMFLAAVGGLVWTINTRAADGSWIALVVPAALGIGVALYTKKNTGSYTSDSAGGR